MSKLSELRERMVKQSIENSNKINEMRENLDITDEIALVDSIGVCLNAVLEHHQMNNWHAHDFRITRGPEINGLNLELRISRQSDIKMGDMPPLKESK